ncbi:alpha-L-arabinofuranosidase C-terminal domain-containing protein [Saccharopolyspora flava]|uniref:Alpha-L-arabinofuranosidase C-terminus n=1 Tax=Saccharopolyspora flava TaxID=95161 RepID=A0A1I6TJL1_9PSEU|nr:alpha-L-arabinofuranosidase C-terminal domain-containing protein [Saccharopolyspora flava]SFS89413.1 Alpha-L-arabinofuranosidase C-terminus [Saccharopolyspora flava]
MISNSGPSAEGGTFDRAWELNRQHDVDVVDEHYYNDPQWFLANQHRYDSYDRNGPSVFVGEYASKDEKFGNALAEAAYMTGLERNADVVRMASYAPLLARSDSVQWLPDMIWFDDQRSWGSPNYEVQKLFMTNDGDRVVPSTAMDTPEFRQVVTRDEATGGLLIKVVNAQPNPAPTRIDLGREVNPRAQVTTLQGDPEAINTAGSQPIRPVESTFDGAASSFTYTFPPHSATFLRIHP